MARQTRSERRARRAAQQAAEPAVVRAGVAGGRGAKPPVRLAPEPPARPERRRESVGGFRRFLVESWGELKKVEWPGQAHVIQGTVVVLIACILVGFYIWIADISFRHLVQDVFLR